MTNITPTTLAWHFTHDTLRNGDPIPPIGEWLEFTGEVVMCHSGLHASRHPMDALYHAPGNILHRVECADVVEGQDDKLVCRRRRIVQTVDCERMIRRFAKDQALSVSHLWKMPAIVREYLESDDENDAARAAARAAAWTAAGDAAWDAAWADAWAAAWAAAGDAAWTAAWAAARDEFSKRVEELFQTNQ